MAHSPTALVIGATGIVGSGIAAALLNAGWTVLALGRNANRLAALAGTHNGAIKTIVGSIDSEEAAEKAAADVRNVHAGLDAVITTVNQPPESARLLDMSAKALADMFHNNVVTHHNAAKSFLKMLAPGGRYIGMGGGMADFTVPGLAGVSVCQAAQRNLFRFLAQECEGTDVSIVELMLYSHIVALGDEEVADARSIRASEVGQHVLAILDRPDEFMGPILTLKSRKQVGMSERSA